MLPIFSRASLRRLSGLAPVLMSAACTMTPLSKPDLKPEAFDLPAFFTCLRDSGQVVVSAHRGAPSAGQAENTLEAYSALAGRRDIIAETDIRMTRDGQLVLSHDARLDRSTTLSGNVSDRDWAEISQAWTRTMHGETTTHHPATLPTLLAIFRAGPALQLDIKDGVSIEAVMDAVEAGRAQGRVIYLAYTDEDIEAIIRRQPDAMISTVIPSLDRLEQLVDMGARLDRLQAMFFESAIDPVLFSQLRDKGVTILVAASQAEEDAQHVSRPLAAQRYVAIKASGAQILVSNHPLDVAMALASPHEARCRSQ